MQSTYEIHRDEISYRSDGNVRLGAEGVKVRDDFLGIEGRGLVDEGFGIGVGLGEIDGLEQLSESSLGRDPILGGRVSYLKRP